MPFLKFQNFCLKLSDRCSCSWAECRGPPTAETDIEPPKLTSEIQAETKPAQIDPEAPSEAIQKHFYKRSSPSRTSCTMITGYSKIFRKWPRENSGFCTVVPPTGTRRMHKQKLGVADLPCETDPQKGQPDTAICSPSPGAVCERMLDVLRPRELGPRGHVVFHNFPDFSGTGHGKNPEVSRQAPLWLVVPHQLTHQPLQSNNYDTFPEFIRAERAFFVRFERRLACNLAIVVIRNGGAPALNEFGPDASHLNAVSHEFYEIQFNLSAIPNEVYLSLRSCHENGSVWAARVPTKMETYGIRWV
ncbi:hypothetical protein EVAR_83856_1 [Eumeta japonica]|uniref:Uncharacterized protein n=1 Tax=Eumeta variegata TaxID=151549 RepID=A0A4C1USF2_EUMVA|nr:hypothetical protein EVAR_83856_1 [Eumeta japonica]